MQQHVYIIFPKNIYSEFEQVLLISFLTDVQLIDWCT